VPASRLLLIQKPVSLLRFISIDFFNHSGATTMADPSNRFNVDTLASIMALLAVLLIRAGLVKAIPW
jgi:hypothetical protein